LAPPMATSRRCPRGAVALALLPCALAGFQARVPPSGGVASIAAPPDKLPRVSLPDVVPDVLTLPSTIPLAPPPPKGPSEYDLNRGRVIDTLRKDYPRYFTAKPDFSIFRSDVELHDPSGKRLQGLKQYERVFDMLRFLRRTTMQDAQLTQRLVISGEAVRVRWSAKLWMRDPALGYNTFAGEPVLVHLDGISVYDLDAKGFVRAHRLENLQLTGREQREVKLAFAWPVSGQAMPELAVPFFRSLVSAVGDAASPESRVPPTQPRAAEPTMVAPSDSPHDGARDTSPARDLLSELLGVFKLPEACETSYDCDAPSVCCDLLVARVCCDGGMLIPAARSPVPQPRAIPIPIDPPAYPGADGYPPQQGGYPQGYPNY